MAQTGIFVPAGVYLLDFLTLAPQRSSSNSIVPSISQIRLVGHARARALSAAGFQQRHRLLLVAWHPPVARAGSPAAFVFISCPWVGGGGGDRGRVGRVFSPPSFGCAGARLLMTNRL